LDKLSVTEKDDYLYEHRGQVSIERGEELFFHGGKISPTSLEGYFACPFRHFAERGLRLKEREEAVVLAMDTGDFIHALLEKTAKTWKEFPTEKELATHARLVGEELLKSTSFLAQQDTGAGEYFSKKLLKEGVEVVLAAARQIRNSDFDVEKTELSVDAEFFHGKVDRVDSSKDYVRVIDYKTGSIDDSATSYYTGQKLQMQLYMQEVKGSKIPAGVFYFPASAEYTDEGEAKFQMQGFLNGSEEALRCGDKNITEDKKSEYFPASLKNSASAKRVMEEEVFCDFLDYSLFVARQGCVELKEGYIAPSPYEGKCKYCKYGGMCGFDKEICSTRKEKNIDPATIANVAKEKRDGKEE
jgi:ATP-dependent helicase/nuclease subunit B